MQRKIMPAIVSVIASALLLTSLCLLFNLMLSHASAATPKIIAQFSSPLATTTTSTSTATQPTSGLDPAIIAALIGLAGVVVGALIAGAFALKSARRTAEIEREKQAEQFKHDQEMERLRKELEAQYKAKEQEEQREETKAEALRLKMLLAQTNAERAKAYRLAVHADPRISRLQILDMSRPLEVASIYVRVRVHQDVRAGYEIDRALLEAEAERDPNAILKAGFKRLETRVSSAIDPDEAIRKYKRCVFVGDPGAGKTTLLKYLTLKSADNMLTDLPDLPIRIELKAFAGSGYQDLQDFAASEWEVDYGFPKIDARSYMEENLLAGKALLLLDALDETVIGDTFDTAEGSYQRVADTIMQAATRYHQSPMVVTARKAGYQQRAQLVGFTELEVLDFRLEEMQQFVTNWFDCYEDPQKRANAADLNTKLQRNPRIQALAANPLLLSLIVLVYEAQLDLPDRRAEMYKECVDTLLTKWDAKRNIRRRREFKPEHKRQLLAELAWHFHLQGRRYFPESEVLAVIADFLPKVRLLPEQNGQVPAEIANEQGLLKEQARGWQGFLHLTLQEYFVAQYVTDHQQLDALLPHCGDPWWEEVTLLYAGYTPDASPMLRKLLGLDDQGRQQQQDDLFQTNLILAGRCLAARPTIQQIPLWETIINRLFESLTKTPFSMTIEHIARALAAIGSTEVNSRLLQLLSNEQPDKYIRMAIAAALGTLGERSVAPDLLRLLSDQQLGSGVRRSIAALATLANDEESVRIMATLLLTSDIADSIHRALWAASHRAGVRVYIIEGEHREKQVKIVKL
jgi:predicted NACHT family NTPase